MFNNIIKVIQ